MSKKGLPKRGYLRPGPKTTNGYLNYLREVRKITRGITAVEAVILGARQWNKLSRTQKEKYNRMARKVKRQQQSKNRSLKCSERAKKPRSILRLKHREDCQQYRAPVNSRVRFLRVRPGPITGNGYLNFLREVRKLHRGLSPVELVKQGAQIWCSLTSHQRRAYKKMGRRVRRSRRKRKCS